MQLNTQYLKRLETIQKLKDDGVLSEEEFGKQKHNDEEFGGVITLYIHIHRRKHYVLIHIQFILYVLCYCMFVLIMEYGSTPYVGMARGKNGRRIKYVQNHILKSLLFT